MSEYCTGFEQNVHIMVMEHFKGNVAAMTQWYATPVEELEDNTPNGLLLSGKDAKLYNYVINTLM